MSKAKVTLIGNLGSDPELKSVGNGQVCNFSLACSVGWGDKKQTIWFKVGAWGKQAEACERYLSKGSKVDVEGRLTTRVWTDREGAEHTDLVVNATDVTFLNSKEDRGSQQQSFGDPRQNPAIDQVPPSTGQTITDEDIPF